MIASLAKHHCANWNHGICVGTQCQPNGSHSRFLPESTNCLLLLGKRCAYFEQSVLPMAELSWEWKSSVAENTFKERADTYRRLHSGITGLHRNQRKCPDCREPIGPRKRFCEKCSAKRRLQTFCASQQKKRKGASDVNS